MHVCVCECVCVCAHACVCNPNTYISEELWRVLNTPYHHFLFMAQLLCNHRLHIAHVSEFLPEDELQSLLEMLQKFFTQP